MLLAVLVLLLLKEEEVVVVEEEVVVEVVTAPVKKMDLAGEEGLWGGTHVAKHVK